MTSSPASGPPGPEPTERELWARWAEGREPEVREQLVERYLWLSRVIALKIYRHCDAREVDVRDLIQCATVGLLEAVDRFHPDGRSSFSTFAAKRMRGAVHDALDGYTERLSQTEFRRRVRRERAASVRSGRKRRKARTAVFEDMVELAVGLAIGTMLEDTALAPADEHRAGGLDAYQATENRMLQERLAHVVATLPPREAQVIRYHYYYEMDFVRIAGLLQVSKSRISQIHAQALRVIREALRSTGGLDLKA